MPIQKTEQRIYPLYLPHLKMDAEMSDTENKTSPAAPEKQLSENKTRGRGAKLRGRGGRGGMRSGMRGGRGMIKAFGHPGHVRGPMYDGPFNGFPPMRGMGRMRPYPDPSGHRGRGLMGPPRPPPPPMHLRGPFPPMHR
uniref:Uncharacterized protein n=1 Tax=Knipowitschia caucasica TaxID=637954 RepID=A0AAV2KE17_KNICA